jgi:hypothetical protein
VCIVQDAEGQTVLHWMAMIGAANGQTHQLGGNTEDWDVVAKQLLMTPNADFNIRDATGDTPLRLAARHKQYKVANLLLKFGCDPNASGSDLLTPLHVAVLNCDRFFVAELLNSHECDADPRDNCGPVHTFDLRGSLPLLALRYVVHYHCLRSIRAPIVCLAQTGSQSHATLANPDVRFPCHSFATFASPDVWFACHSFATFASPLAACPVRYTPAHITMKLDDGNSCSKMKLALCFKTGALSEAVEVGRGGDGC